MTHSVAFSTSALKKHQITLLKLINRGFFNKIGLTGRRSWQIDSKLLIHVPNKSRAVQTTAVRNLKSVRFAQIGLSKIDDRIDP